MKRACQTLILILLSAVLLNGVLTAAARAGCAEEVKTVRGPLAAVKDEHRRQEVQKLIEKAEKDNRAGRVALCDQAAPHARTVLTSSGAAAVNDFTNR